MRLEKSSFGYKLIAGQKSRQDDNDFCDPLSQTHLNYLSGLVKRLRNLFLSVVPVDYCCIALYGEENQCEPCETDSDQQIEARSLAYLGQEIGVLRYRLGETISNEDRAKIEMLADLFGYLIYHHLLMYEFLNND